jgi:putative endonuclease
MATTPAGNDGAADRRRDLGCRGEEAAAQCYARSGYQTVARNWRCPLGEIDLVVVDPRGDVVFCEVKTRSQTAFGRPEEAVTPSKQRRLRRLAAEWLTHHRGTGGPARPVRFDVAAVTVDRSRGLVVELVHDAF